MIFNTWGQKEIKMLFEKKKKKKHKIIPKYHFLKNSLWRVQLLGRQNLTQRLVSSSYEKKPSKFLMESDEINRDRPIFLCPLIVNKDRLLFLSSLT